MALSTDRRYRWIYKPLLFMACLAPLGLATLGLLGLTFGDSAFATDPQRRLLGIFGVSTLNLLLITLAVTPLRQLTGNAHLLRLRRMLGVFAFSYALLHFLTYGVLIAGLDLTYIVDDIIKRPYITIGMLALLLLIPLAISSTNAMMRRLKRRWQILHRLIYPIAILGVWHFWWQVKKDIVEPLIYAAILAALLGWRLHRRTRLPQLGEKPQL